VTLVPGDGQDVIISTGNLGGLGDWMLYSTLPRRYAELGHKVYVSSQNLARNPEISDLVFAMNKYVVGTSDKQENAGYRNQGLFYEIANRFPLGSIEAMERAHGFGPPYSLAPEIHYQPQPFIIDLSQCVLVDYGAVSSSLKVEALQAFHPLMQLRFNRQMYMVTFTDSVVANTPPLEGPRIKMESIFQYIDALASCYAWIGSEAGGQSLAAAVRGEHDVYDMEARPEIVVCSSTMTYNARGYVYRGADYRVTIHHSNSISDYFGTLGTWQPPEVAYARYQRDAQRSVEAARAEWDAAEKARLAGA
jgi:hypothetical protein